MPDRTALPRRFEIPEGRRDASGIVPDNAIQYNLFEDPPGALHELVKAVDNVNFSMRNDMVKFAASGTRRNWKMRQEMRSKTVHHALGGII
ncbi:MAG: DUF4113 domain-containing protein [Chitinophagaceae bacterium]|nr:DUF4113 domain-containing protein [Chitinophagaceae bacterium]